MGNWRKEYPAYLPAVMHISLVWFIVAVEKKQNNATKAINRIFVILLSFCYYLRFVTSLLCIKKYYFLSFVLVPYSFCS
jgi:hypothetical protein